MGAKLVIFVDIFGCGWASFSKLGSKTIFIGFPTPDPQKPDENLRFFKDFTFSARSLWTSILGRFFVHSDPRSDENRSPEASERDPKKDTKRYCVWKLRDRFCIDFGTQLGSWGGVREGRFGHFFRSWSCLGGKMAPGCPKSASKTDFGPILVDLGTIFNEFLMLLPPFLLALKRELSVEFGPLCRSRGYCYVLPSCGNSLTIHSQNPFIEARWRRWPEGQLDILIAFRGALSH